MTEAYLTLSDPVRRSNYNTLMGLHKNIQIEPGQRTEEKGAWPGCSTTAAPTPWPPWTIRPRSTCSRKPHAWTRKSGYFAALGQAQAKNPNWRKHAVESYEKAIELDKSNAGLFVAFGQVLEQVGETVRATQQFQQALTLMPNHPTAIDAIARLTEKSRGTAARPASKPPWLGPPPGLEQAFEGRKETIGPRRSGANAAGSSRASTSEGVLALVVAPLRRLGTRRQRSRRGKAFLAIFSTGAFCREALTRRAGRQRPA